MTKSLDSAAAGAPASLALAACNPHGQGVRVEFTQQGDRFGHTLFALQDQNVWPLCTSVEESAQAYFPVSPPWAELHRQEQTLFLTGATSFAHWSMTVRAVSDLAPRPIDPAAATELGGAGGSSMFGEYNANGGSLGCGDSKQGLGGGLVFEVACRLKAEPSVLGSQYQCQDSAAGPAQDEPGLLWTGSGRVLCVLLDCEVPVAKQAPATMTREGALLRIGPSNQLPQQYPATLQWRYGICWSPT